MAVSALLLAMMIGFAAEPTTSTELDRIEGRAYAGVVHARAQVQSTEHVTVLPSRTLAVVLVAVIALLWLVSRPGVLVTTSVRAARSLRWWAVPSRRGPPALV